jgi:hypothetical protein
MSPLFSTIVCIYNHSTNRSVIKTNSWFKRRACATISYTLLLGARQLHPYHLNQDRHSFSTTRSLLKRNKSYNSWTDDSASKPLFSIVNSCKNFSLINLCNLTNYPLTTDTDLIIASNSSIRSRFFLEANSKILQVLKLYCFLYQLSHS